MYIKKLIIAMAAVALFISISAPAAYASGNYIFDKTNFIFDETGVLTDAQVNYLNEKAAALAEKRGCGAYIHIVDLIPEIYAISIDNMEIYAEAFFINNGLGYGSDGNGMMLILETGDVPGERDYLFYTRGPCRKVFDNNTRERILDEEIVPLFRRAFDNGDFFAVADAFLDSVANEFASNFTARLAAKLAATILAPLIIAWAVCAYWKRQMKTAVPAKTADTYIPADGFQLTVKEDAFLYRTTARRKIERESSSSGGGSSSSGSGGSSGGKV